MVRIQKITKYHLFNEGSISTLINSKRIRLQDEIFSFQNEHFSNIDQETLLGNLIQRYKINEIILYEDKRTKSKLIDKQIDVSWEKDRDIRDRSKPFYIRGKSITFTVPFKGDVILLKLRSSNFIPTGFSKAEVSQNEMSISYDIYNYNNNNNKEVADFIIKTFEQDLSLIKKDLKHINNEVLDYNHSLEKYIKELLLKRKAELLFDSDLEELIDFPLRDTDNLKNIKGIGNTYSKLLEDAGINTIPELSKESAEKLYSKILKVNEDKQITERNPSLQTLIDWINKSNEQLREIKEELRAVNLKLNNFSDISKEQLNLLKNIKEDSKLIREIDKKLDSLLPGIKSELKTWIEQIKSSQISEKDSFIKELEKILKLESSSKIIASIPLIPGFLKLQHEFGFTVNWFKWFEKLKEIFSKRN